MAEPAPDSPSRGWQLTSVLHALGAGRRRTRARPAAVVPSLARPTLEARVSWAGHTTTAAHRLRERVDSLDARSRAQVLDPLGAGSRDGTVRWGDDPARQVDQRSCGGTVLAMLAAQGDPALALWIVTGEDVTGAEPVARPAGPGGPRSVAGLRLPVLALHATPLDRFHALAAGLRRAATHRGPVPTWPAAWGTPPWGAARVARYGGERFTHRMIDDYQADVLRRVITAALRAATQGVPVPLYVGGDGSGGARSAVPRHVVLLHRPDPAGGLRVFDPSVGTVLPLEPEDLARPGVPREAYGGWSHVCWALLPR